MKKDTKRCISWIVIGVLWIIAVGVAAFIMSILR